MPIKSGLIAKNLASDGKREMTIEEFKRWLKKYDADKDGRINREELGRAVRATGGWFSGRKAKQGVIAADSNGDGFIDDNEITELLDFAQKYLAVRIVPY